LLARHSGGSAPPLPQQRRLTLPKDGIFNTRSTAHWLRVRPRRAPKRIGGYKAVAGRSLLSAANSV